MKWSFLLLLLSAPVMAEDSLSEHCLKSLKGLPGKVSEEIVKGICEKAAQLPDCVSEKGVRIFHYDHAARASEKEPKHILVFSLIHGDELASGILARKWMERLTTIEPRNIWRVVPILNPDGLAKRTRFNANGVDVNRNFPTSDWDKDALKYWETKTKKDKRRFPGNKANSEKETRCAIAHIEDFKPDLILSVHTPYGVLDFDGPTIQRPNFSPIPWKRLGNYPGSMGRYMWIDRSKPILTVELGSEKIDKLEQFDRLQDISGDIAIKAENILKGKTNPPAKDEKAKPEKSSEKISETSAAPEKKTP